MRSTQEYNLEKNAEKIEALERKRQKAIEDGLNRIDSLDDDKVSQELTHRDYVAAAHAGLRKILKHAQIADGDE